MDEQWREILSHDEGYEVSDQGRVRSYRSKGRAGLSKEPHLMSIQKSGGKPWVMLMTHDRGPRPSKVHTLVLEAFVGHRPPGMYARHLSGDVFDARLENLAWGTMTESVGDLKRAGNSKRPNGENHNLAVLTNEQVIRAKNLYLDGRSVVDLAQEFGIAEPTMRGIMMGNVWCDVGPDMREQYRYNWHWQTDEEREAMFDDVKSGMFMTDVAKKYGINTSSLSRVFERHNGMKIRDYRRLVSA